MSFQALMLQMGEDLQYAAFFGGLCLLLALEFAIPRRTTPRDRAHRWRANFVLTAANVVALGFVPVSFIGASIWAQGEGIGLLNQIALPDWLVVPVALLLRGLISTGTHLLNHQLPWLWRIHRVHHLDTELDVTSTVRFHPLELFVNPVIGVPVVVLFGLPAWTLVVYEVLDVGITLFSHANIRIAARVNRWLRYLIVTPDLHRIHHSSWQPETDSNYGAVFPIWDIVLGTFRPEARGRQEDMQLGLAEARGAETSSVLALFMAPVRATRGRTPALAPAEPHDGGNPA